MQAKHRGVAVVLVTHSVAHAMTVGDHFAVLIRGEKADDFAKGERTREQITDLMAGGEAMHELEAELALLTGSMPTIN
jgi:simple sugar transport system ATP-binding protein